MQKDFFDSIGQTRTSSFEGRTNGLDHDEELPLFLRSPETTD